MQTLKGSIMSLFDQKLPDRCSVVICIYDCTNLDKKLEPVLVRKLEFYNPAAFPIKYEIDYPRAKKVHNERSLYNMSVRIFKNDTILYSNNCKDVIAKNQRFRKNLDVFLYYLPFYK